MKKLLFWILTFLWIFFSFCSADFIVYEAWNYPADCSLTWYNYRVPEWFSSFSSNYNCLSPYDFTDIYFTTSNWTILAKFDYNSASLVCSSDSVFYFDNRLGSSFWTYFQACNIDFPVSSPKFKVNYGSTSYEYELEDNLFIYLKSPVIQSWNTFTYAWSTWINLYFNWSSQFYNKSKLFLNTPSWFSNNVFTPICL